MLSPTGLNLRFHRRRLLLDRKEGKETSEIIA